MEHAIYMAKVFHELDPVTPVTIGATFAENMIEMGDAVDVLSFHNYSPTRAQIRASIEKAKQRTRQKRESRWSTVRSDVSPVRTRMTSRSRSTCRPRSGGTSGKWWITGYWGPVHGVFYPDGTVRDPSTVAALLGMFRNRGRDVVEKWLPTGRTMSRRP